MLPPRAQDKARLQLHHRGLAAPAGLYERPRLELIDTLLLTATALHRVAGGASPPSLKHLAAAYDMVHLAASLLKRAELEGR
eukprot:54780-Chlamydomonas_euryale.AAC.1